jgi:hypothetical protein
MLVRDAGLAAGAGNDTQRPTGLSANLALIWPLLGRHIAFHRSLVDLTASVKAALLLSQTIYWTRHGKDVATAGGWFFKTTNQWEMETGLSPKEQFSARLVLRNLAILSERRNGVPAKLYFRLAAEELASLLSARIGAASGRLDWADGAAVAELLGPALAYHRTLAAIAGGVNAGLLLSRALHLTRLQSKNRPDGWICRSMTQWTEEIGLTRREQETARRELARAGIWEEAINGIPPRLYARVKTGCLQMLLVSHAGRERERAQAARVAGFTDCCVPIHSPAQNGNTRRRDSHLLDTPKAPHQFHQKRHHSSAESAEIYIQRSTGVLVQPLRHGETGSEAVDSRSGGDLIFPRQLLPEECAAARALVQNCADQAQPLLDELAARLQANAVRTSPLAYLRGMVARARVGQFVPELGTQIAAARRRNHEDAVLRQEREAESRRLAAERATPEYQAKVAARRAEMQALLTSMQSAEPRRRPQ